MNEEATTAESSDTVTGSNTITGTIVANRDNHITYYNKSLIVDITIQKLDGSGNGLNGAVFQLKTVGNDGKSEALATATEVIGGLGTVTKVVNNETKTYESAFESTGLAQTISHLPDGTYRLYEVYVPVGYISTYRYIQFEIEDHVMKNVTTDTGDTSKLDFTEAAGTGTSARLALLKVTNEPGVALPSTGGMGTHLFTILGSILICLAGASLLLMRRRRRA